MELIPSHATHVMAQTHGDLNLEDASSTRKGLRLPCTYHRELL